MPMIGPFFRINDEIVSHRIFTSQGENRGGKIDNPYSHEKLYDDHYNYGDYIDFPRGRVVFDAERDRAVIYTDTCIEKTDGAVDKIAKLYKLTDFIVEHDEHYVCPSCMGNIWE